ncbi:MAG: FKBP-type peptidyl-prolyl cis-trans isomerase [Chitinophagaceae bacterium]|nr:FKBP-type peptidyl-prolyl cis-trans isomerase [Chitinophagaceae bacterium]
MTKFSLRILAVASVAMLCACNGTSYKKTASGLMYTIVSEGNAPQVKIGQIMKLHFTQKINDSLLNSSYGKMPAFVKVDSIGPDYSPVEIFRFLHKGDSATVLQLVDTIMKKNPMGIPPFMKKGDKLTVAFKVVEVYANEALAETEKNKEMEKEKVRMEAESVVKAKEVVKEVEDFIAKKKINAQKTGQGTYVEIKNAGTGMQADSGKYVSVRYTGKLLATEKEFENNVGPEKQPFTFVLGTRQVIPGWDEGLKLLKKGAKATLYIPGNLAYGPQQGPGGKTFESLIFDVELVDVTDNAPAPPTAPQIPLPGN